MLRLWTGVLFLIAMMWGFELSSACKCTVTHPQEHFCKSDFVILATPKYTRDLFDDEHSFYIIVVDKIFKASDAVRAVLTKNVVYYPTPIEKCPTSLVMNKKYVLTGKLNGNYLEIDDCGFQKEWSILPKVLQTNLAGGYKPHCNNSCVIYVKGYHPSIYHYHMCVTRDIRAPDSNNPCLSIFGICKMFPALGTANITLENMNETLQEGFCTWVVKREDCSSLSSNRNDIRTLWLALNPWSS